MNNREIRYTYSTHKTRDRANDALEGYFAAGEVSASERPQVEHESGRYLVTLCDLNLTAYL